MYKRFNHVIKANHQKRAPESIIFFDTETKENRIDERTVDLELKYGFAVHTRRTRRGDFEPVAEFEFDRPLEFCRWVEGRATGAKRHYVVAHNVGFDLRVVALTRHLTANGWRRTSLILDGFKLMATYRRPLPTHRCTSRCRTRKGEKVHHGAHTTIVVMNNQQLFATSLARLGESIGEAKMQIDLATADTASLREYCKQDVRVMIAAWNKWYHYLQDNDLGNFQHTIASQAMSAWRHRFMDVPIKVHTNDAAIGLERASYHGGRVECFYIGERHDGPFYCLDINSMYPHVMRTCPVPVELLQSFNSVSRADFEHVRTNLGYIAEATVHIDEPCLAVQHDGKLVFPIGTVTGTFAKPELEHALERGGLISTGRIVTYREAVAFESFVDFFYDARRRFIADGNDSFAYFSKLILNSLYGKFGQRTPEYQIVGFNPSLPDSSGETYDLTRGSTVKYRTFDGLTEIEVGSKEGYNSFVAIASYITAAARAYLDRLIAKAGRGHVLYCDTDSLFVDGIGRDRLADDIDPSVLGMLKLEAVADDIAIYGPKRYRFGDKARSKGIRKDALEVAPGVFQQVQFEGMLGAIRSGRTDRVRLHTIDKHLRQVYNKGTLTPSGEVLPLRFPLEG